MLLKIKEPLKTADTSVPMLITAATTCVLFMLIAGGLVYANTRRTVTAADWVNHTQEVLNSLRTASQMTDRIDSSTLLFQATNDEARLDVARTSARNLDSAATHLRVLVSDNPEEVINADQLVACSDGISGALNVAGKSAPPRSPIQRCQETIAKMMELERRLLTDREKTSEHTAMVSLTSDFVFVGLAILTLITVFGFLLRAAELRQSTESKVLETNRTLEESVALLQEQADETNVLTTSRDEMQLCVTLQDVYESAKNGFARLMPMTSGALCMLNNSRNMLETVATWGEMALEDCHLPGSCCGLRSGQPRWREPGASEVHCTHFSGQAPERYLCVPIMAHGDTIGLLYVECADAVCMENVHHRMAGMRQLTQLTGMAVASMKLRMKLEHQSIRDPLTTLFNRNFMEIALERELSRSRRKKQMLAVLMLDVDHFKEFNDRHGHAAGDAVLKAVAEVCQANTRNEDTACRYGGEEFTIILPEITPEHAYERAEALRHAISQVQVRGAGGSYGDLTVSIGLAMFPDDGTTPEVLLQKADQALYRAKGQGRDQVVVAMQPIFAA